MVKKMIRSPTLKWRCSSCSTSPRVMMTTMPQNEIAMPRSWRRLTRSPSMIQAMAMMNIGATAFTSTALIVPV